MTERGRDDLRRSADWLAIGPGEVTWDGRELRLRLDEVTVPWPSRLRGEVRFRPEAVTARSFSLDAACRHWWWPIAPYGRVELAMAEPERRWTGHGYLDCNAGEAPLEQDFVRWDWSRAALRKQSVILYDADRRDGSRLSLALGCDHSGSIRELDPPPMAALRRTAWGIERRTRADRGIPVHVTRTLESGPFYARSLLRTSLAGEAAMAIHESVSLDRFAATWVQMMLPFRMPRR